MATTSDFRNGLCLVHNQGLYTIVSFQHVKPGKGGAFVRTKLKNLENGKVIDHTFNAGTKVTTARIERRKYQFLYKTETEFYFMDQETFNQVSIESNLVTSSNFLKEGQEVELLFHQETERILSCELPAFVTLLVTYTEPGAKGDTVNRPMKEAKLETGATIQVPLFIKEGDLLKVDTRTGDYSERVKND